MLPDEPAPIRLMSTIWADTEGAHDDLTSPSDLDAWLQAVGLGEEGTHADDADLADAVRLRDAIRRLAALVTGDTRDAAASPLTSVAAAVTTLNDALGFAAPPVVARQNGRLRLGPDLSIPPVKAGLANVAVEAAQLLAGDDAGSLRACYAPGCVLYFVRSHPRREWCSISCGNRERAARHYQRVRAQRNQRS